MLAAASFSLECNARPPAGSWRSEYLRWRVETYSGQRAETLTAERSFEFCLGFALGAAELSAWTGRLDREVHKRVHLIAGIDLPASGELAEIRGCFP